MTCTYATLNHTLEEQPSRNGTAAASRPRKSEPNFIQRFFLVLSKTDRDILAGTTDYSRSSQVSLGGFVLATTLFATMSCWYALSISLDPLVAILPSLVYGWFILLLDREIVSAPSGWAVLVRFPLAIFVALVMALSLELGIFTDQIEREMRLETLDLNRQLTVQAEADYGVADQEARVDSLDALLRPLYERMKVASDKMYGEEAGITGEGLSGEQGKGERYVAAEEYQVRTQAQIDRLEKQKREAEMELRQLRSRADMEASARAEEVADGLLGRFMALHRVIQAEPSAGILVWIVRLLILLIDTAPLLAKLMLPSTEYQVALRQRMKVNRTRIEQTANHFTERYEQYPERPPSRSFLDHLRRPSLAA